MCDCLGMGLALQQHAAWLVPTGQQWSWYSVGGPQECPADITVCTDDALQGNVMCEIMYVQTASIVTRRFSCIGKWYGNQLFCITLCAIMYRDVIAHVLRTSAMPCDCLLKTVVIDSLLIVF